MTRPPWLVQLKIAYYRHRARKDMSPLAWADHRRRIEESARFSDEREIEHQCQAMRDMVARLEVAAAVGSKEARERLKALRFNTIGKAAADAAEKALKRLSDKMIKDAKK